MRKELASFGPEFFEEIEDLKYNYRESEIRNAQLEERLRELCQQFGVSMWCSQVETSVHASPSDCHLRQFSAGIECIAICMIGC